MKIILAHYKYYIQGGPERYMFKFIELAEKHNCEVIPFSIEYEDNVESKYSRYFVSSGGAKRSEYSYNQHNPKYLLKMAAQEFHNPEASKKLEKLIVNEKPDMLYALIPGPLTPDIFKTAKKMGLPCIMRLSDFRLICGTFNFLRNGFICEDCIKGNYFCIVKHKCLKNNLIFSILRASALFYHRIKKSYKYVDAVIAPPAFTAKKFIESGYFPKEKIYINPTFIDAKDINVSKYKDYSILCMGRFSESKGFKYVINSLKYINNKQVKIIITGQKEDCDVETLRFINDNGLNDRVIFTGFVHGQALEELVNNCFCVACPAIWYENLPNVILEAFAHGKPIIASNIGSLSDAIDDKENGLLFPVGNAKRIAECIDIMIDDPILYDSMCKKARDKCEKVYSPDNHWKCFCNICKSIGINIAD